MKKVIYFVGVIIALASGSFILANDDDSEKRIGNVGVYEKMVTMSSEECLKNIMRDRAPLRSIDCQVSSNWDFIEKLYFLSKISEIDVPFKGYSKVHISATSTPSGYLIKAFVIDPPTGTISWKEFPDLIEKLIKEKGAELPIKYLKIEKQ